LPVLTSAQLTRISESLLRSAGASDEEARLVTESLVSANIAGVDSHGVFPNLIMYIKNIQKGIIKPGAKFEIVKETPSTALVNGNWGLGQAICTKAMKIAIQKAEENGVSAVGVHNCNNIGRLAHFTKMTLDNDMICFIAANLDPCVAPYGGRKIMLGTNPISYSIPAGTEKPVVIDFSTSMVAEGKVRAALYRKEQIPVGWIVDSQGRPSTNPADLYQPPLPPEQVVLAGALLSFGGHKGYGLGLVVDILGGALTGTGCDGEVTNDFANGIFITAVKIDHFVPIEEFKARVDRLIRALKNSPKAEGFAEILIPGEPEFREEERRSKTGVPIPETAWNALLAACKEYGLDAEKLIHT